LVTEIADSNTNPEHSYFQQERHRILFSAIHEPRPGMRTALQLRDLREQSVRETARILGVSASAEKSRVIRGEGKWKYRAPRDPTQAAETGEASVGTHRVTRTSDVAHTNLPRMQRTTRRELDDWLKPKANSNVGCFGTRRRAGKRIRDRR